MNAKSYVSLLQEHELDYLSTVDTSKMVALDLETAGLTPEASQITQAGMVDALTKRVLVSNRCQLTLETLGSLRKEAESSNLLGRGSTHWVLRYNNYHSIFKSYESYLLDPNNPAPVVTQKEGKLQVMPPDSERPLSPRDFRELLLSTENLLTEEALLLKISSRMQEAPIGFSLVGQNILLFDLPFIMCRAAKYGITPWVPSSCVDTMWVSRILIIPALRTLCLEDPLSDRILGTLGGYNRPSSSLQSLRKAFGCDGGVAHDAVGDCHTNVSVALALIAYAKHAQELLRASESLGLKYKAAVAQAASGPLKH